MKTTYADGDVYSASDVNDTNGTINLLTSSTLSIAAGKNGIINGGFDIWQRGTANVTTANAFTADRWQKNSATHYGISRVAVGDTTNLPQIQYAARIQRTNASATTTVCALVYSMETNDAMKFAGQTVTVSFYARKGANYSGGNFSVIIYTGTGTDQNLVTGYTGGAAQVTASAALTTSMARYTATVTLPATATEIGLYCAFTPTGTAGANDYVDMTGVQLELGSTATTFSRAGGTIQGELAACQRYLPTVPVATGDFAFAQCFSTSKALVTIPYFVQPRVAPTGVTVSAAASFALRTATAGFTFATTVAFNNATLNSANLEVTAGVALIAGNASTFYNSAGSLLFTGCEL
jgi:roadblock/LC7 domain-containing protein